MKNCVTKRLETKRLIIDRGTSDDCKKIYEYDLTKCTGIDNQNTLVKFDSPVDFIGDDADLYYEKCQKGNIFDWYIFLKQNHKVVANILAERQDNEKNSIEIIYNTHPNYWGNGYVPEALKKIFDYLKELGYKKVYVHLFEGNSKSKRVCEKLNFKFNKKDVKLYKPTGKNIVEYEYVLELV